MSAMVVSGGAGVRGTLCPKNVQLRSRPLTVTARSVAARRVAVARSRRRPRHTDKLPLLSDFSTPLRRGRSPTPSLVNSRPKTGIVRWLEMIQRGEERRTTGKSDSQSGLFSG